MDVRVVCISRTLAAGGELIGQMVAQRLGFRYVDEHIITKAAAIAQVDPALVAAAEHRRPLLQRLIDKLAAASELVGPLSLATGVPMDIFAKPPQGYRVTPEDLQVLIRVAIHEVAATGQSVIVAHAASMALAGTAGVLRALITASPDTRVQRLVSQGARQEEAAKSVAASDRERRDYIRRFYGVADELPTHYDVVINTDVLPLAQAKEAIVALAERPA